MIYQIEDKPKTIKEYLLYGAQQCISVLAATLLIAKLCGTDPAAGMISAGIATIVFLCLTKFKVPLFFSNSGSTVGAVQMALAAAPGNYLYVIIGGIAICLMNLFVSFVIKKFGSKVISSILPPIVSGTIVIIIGLHLSTFCASYVLDNGAYNIKHVIVAFITMFTSALTMHYAKGKAKTLPLLIGALVGYVFAFMFNIIDFSSFSEMTLFTKPVFAFNNVDLSAFNWGQFIAITLAFLAVNLANLSEHISDVAAVSTVVGRDIAEEVGYDKTMAGDGIADLVGTVISGQPTTTYSESLSTIALSKVASTRVILVGAIMLCLLGFFGPFNAFINSMPSCIFAGLGLVAYGCISFAGIRTLHEVELTPRNMIIFGCMATVGISGVAITIGNFNLATIALSMIVGLVLNLILK